MGKPKINKLSVGASTAVAFAICLITLFGTWYLNKSAARREVVAYKDMIISGIKAEKENTELYMRNANNIVGAIKRRDDLNAGPSGLNSIHLQWLESIPKEKAISALVINVRCKHNKKDQTGYQLLRNIDEVIYYYQCINVQYTEYRAMVGQLREDWCREFSQLYKTVLTENASRGTDKKERLFFRQAYTLITDCIERDELYRNFFGSNMPMTAKKELLIDRLDSLINSDKRHYQIQSIVPVICSKDELNLLYLNFQASKKYSDNILNHLDSMRIKQDDLYRNIAELEKCKTLSFWKIK